MATARFALHTWTLDSTPLTDVLRIARETGWNAVELRRVDFARAAAAGRSAEAVLAEVKASGLPVACVGVELGWMTADGAERTRLLEVFDESCRWANALGCATVMSPVDKGAGDDAKGAASIRDAGDIAARHGVRLALEFNALCEYWNTLARVRAVVARAAHPACGLLIDTYHLGKSGAAPAELDALDPAEIAYVQYSDVPRDPKPGVNTDRLPPGQGTVPIRDIFARLLKKGYAGYLSYEAPNPAAWAREPAAVAREALEASRVQVG
ncbi:MAG TPA: sugar phosphate isomerase/epimerase [Terriglobales bacterium]|nr:sugar phosphate isomerase/epimerase [Terriglobales bacterium]